MKALAFLLHNCLNLLAVLFLSCKDVLIKLLRAFLHLNDACLAHNFRIYKIRANQVAPIHSNNWDLDLFTIQFEKLPNLFVYGVSIIRPIVVVGKLSRL